MPPPFSVAPLPHWPIDGQVFNPVLHLSRVLAVFGCHMWCPAVRHYLIYFDSVFSNERDETTGLQTLTPETRLCFSVDDFLFRQNVDHDHPVDSDLVYSYPRIHLSPFPFSRPIRLRLPDDGTTREFHVVDIHLRWSEIHTAVSSLGLRSQSCPLRYGNRGYPFNRSYFYDVCDMFSLYQGPFGSPRLSLLHVETGYPAEPAMFARLLDLIHELNNDRSDDDLDSPEAPYILRLTPSEFVTELQALRRRWWPQAGNVVLYIRFLLLENWLDRLSDRGCPPDTDFVRLAQQTAPVFEPTLLFYA